MEHTKGPWKSGGGTIYAPWPQGVGDRIIADLLTHHGDNGLTNDEVTANAKLMAASPDMLEALEAAHEMIHDRLCLGSQKPGYAKPRKYDCWPQCTAATAAIEAARSN